MNNIRFSRKSFALSLFRLTLLGMLFGYTSVDADNTAGMKYFNAKQYQQAYKEFYAAAMKGDETSAFNLGYMYQHGIGVKIDHLEAAKWLKKSADLGYVDAMMELGIIYENGDNNMPGDIYAQALSWYKKAAAKGNSDGQYKIGNFYKFGFGVKKDDVQAVSWYRQAAAQGNKYAQYELGNLYEYGNNIKKDYGQALALYRKSALQGNVRAQVSLGEMYEEGKGVPKDLKLALQWCQKAADTGDDNRAGCVKRLKK
ncbi:tetratricopeptide repeat protein [Deinococcus sp.]|uniref:tetratricopeptide repeat protein n=1 Tax=Deinococcus sp. TaxID=47478 RepID=UPI003CC65596